MADLTNQLQAAAGASTGVASDADFENTVLLLHGDGTNGAQNNTFIDSSTNNFTITRNGNTTQGTFTPFSKPDGRWGNYFDGNGDFLTCPNSSDLNFSTGDVTLEAWVYLNAISGTQTVLAAFATGGVGITSWALTVNSSGFLLMDTWVSGTEQFITATNNALVANQWTHVAYTRASGTSRFFVNGVSCTFSGSISQSIDAGGNLGSLGSSRYAGFEGYLNGYISNARIVKGTAVYTSGFTPSTTPLTAISGTSLLTCQSNRFIDNSSNAFAITRNGDVRVTPFSPFPITTAYSTSVNGGAGYFDGSGDYLGCGSNNAFAMGTGDFTWEAWIYFGSGSSYRQIFSTRPSNGASSAEGSLAVNPSNGLTWWTSGFIIDYTTSIGVNQWVHVAISRSGTTLRVFANGVQVGSATNSENLTGNGFTIGANGNGSEAFNGYISNVRVVKGTAVYTAAFTPPTSPVTAITNTSLLCNFTNAGIFDNTGFNALETVGNAQIDTTTKKYGTGSMEFDTSGDSLNGLSDPNLNMGTGDWTIEGWVNVTSRNTNYPLVIGNNNGSFTAGALALTVSNSDNASYNDRFVLAAHDMGATGPDRLIVASSTNSTGVWYHFAVVRNGTNLSIYRDGTSVGSKTISAGVVFDWGKGGLRIGGNNWDGAQSYFNGYIDDLRITKGIARYTTTFTPPTAALPDLGA
jgi:hypothetical protein